ncbi:MAG: hypothetical protein VW146_02080 [Gammaproteobacteria bacterium]
MESPQYYLALSMIAVGASVFLLRRLVYLAKSFISSPNTIRVTGYIRLILGASVLWYVFSLEHIETWSILVLVIGCLLLFSGLIMAFFVLFSQKLIENHLEKIVPVVSLTICLIGVLLL